MKSKIKKHTAHKGANGGAVWPLSQTSPVHAVEATNKPTIVEPQASFTIRMNTPHAEAGVTESVMMTLVLNRAAHRVCTCTALRLGMVLCEYTSAHSRLFGLYATAAEARNVVHQIREAVAKASPQPA